MDSHRKRASAASVAKFFRPRTVVADGAITAGDRAQIAWSYRGAFADAVADGGAAATVASYIPAFRPRRR
jgi:hypothetical protein